MVKIKLLAEHAGKQAGEVIEVTRNVAHGLIERGIATLGGVKTYSNKMMTTETRGVKSKRKTND